MGRKQKIKKLYPQLFRTKRKLQRRMTLAEKRFKAYLEEMGIKYRFQKALTTNKLSNFRVVDFYIPRTRLVFEIDGLYHQSISQEIKDDKRIEEIHKRRPGLLFIRFSNEEIFKEPKRIKSIISEVFRERYKPKRSRK